MEIKEIKKLIDKITKDGITDFEMEKGDFKIRIRKNAPAIINEASPVQSPKEVSVDTPMMVPSEKQAVVEPEERVKTKPDEHVHVVSSPMVGTFYAAPSPGAAPYVSVGDRVKLGQVACIVEAMKILNEIQFDVEGTITEIHAKNEQPVEYGEPLFSIDTEA